MYAFAFKRMTSREVLKWLEKKGSRRYKDGLFRYGIVAPKAFGVPVAVLLKFAKLWEMQQQPPGAPTPAPPG